MLGLRCAIRTNKFRPMSTSAASLVVNPNKNILIVELNRPKVLNALSKEMCDELVSLLQTRINAPDSTIAAFVMKGNGGKAFCAG